MNHEIHVITNITGCKSLQDPREAHKVLSDAGVGDIIRIVHKNKCIDELMVIDGDIDNRCEICAASNHNNHYYLCLYTPCAKSVNPRILVSVSDILEDL